MIVYSLNQVKKIAAAIKGGYIVVMPTDTIYGICALAFNQKAVAKVYALRQRAKNKPCIILIGKIEDLERFQIKLKPQLKSLLNSIWPNRISVVLPCQSKKFAYLHRGVNTLSFRLPDSKFLLRLLNLTGPVVAPSANSQGKKPAQDIDEASGYFADTVMYVDGRTIKNQPSTLIKIEENFDLKILRQSEMSGNKYYLMRHGEAVSNIENRLSSYPEKFYNPLTAKGKLQVTKNIKKLKKFRINIIIASPLLRTKQTAQIISSILKTPLKFDLRLRELDFGVLNSKEIGRYQNLFKSHCEKYLKAPPNGETLRQVKLRILQVIFELEKKFKNKNILIVSHQDPLWVLAGSVQGLAEKETAADKNLILNLSQIRRVDFLNPYKRNKR